MLEQQTSTLSTPFLYDTFPQKGSPPPLPMQMLAIAFSPDSRLMAAGGIQIALWPRMSRGGIYLYDVPRRESIATLFPDDGRSGVEHGIAALAFSPDGHLLAAGTDRGDVHLWTLPDLEPLPPQKAEGYIRVLEFSPDGRILAVGSETSGCLLRAPGFDRIAPAEAVRFPSDTLYQRPQAELLRIGFDRQGATLTSLWGHTPSHSGEDQGPSRGIAVWSAEGKHLLSFDHQRPNWFDVDRDGELAVTADQKILRIWRLQGRRGRPSLLRA